MRATFFEIIAKVALSTDEIETKTYGDIEFREGDRVMQVKNNYDIYWEKSKTKINYGVDHGSGVFNGELGIISKIDNVDKNIEVEFDDGKVAWYAFSELEQLEHAYSITIHKAQRKWIWCCNFSCTTSFKYVTNKKFTLYRNDKS